MRKLSIITINYNNREGLRQTLQSIVEQTDKDFEYIVVDGASTDGSVDVIREYESHITKWVSEPDTGIYNAMNKGVRIATGEYCLFLNSGDWLYANTIIKNITPYLGENYDILTGNINLIYADGKSISHKKRIPEQISLSFFLQTTLPHQSTFIKRSLLINRPYNESYRVIADWVFFIDTYRYDNPQYKRIKLTISNYDMGGFSNQNGRLYDDEKKKYFETISSIYLVKEINQIPYQINQSICTISNSYRFKKALIILIENIIKIYNKLYKLKR